MSSYAGALTAAVVLTASIGTSSTFAGSGSAPPQRAQQRLWADEVSEAIRGTARRDVTRTGEIGKAGSTANSGAASGSGTARGEGAATGPDRGKSGEGGDG